MEMRTRGALGPPAKRIVRSDAYGNRTPPSPPKFDLDTYA